MTEIRLTNYNMAAARIIGALLFVPLLGFIAYALLSHEWTKVVPVVAGFLALAGALGFLWMAANVVLSLRLGEKVAIRRIWGVRRLDLADIEAIAFQTVRTTVDYVPTARTRVVTVHLRGGGNFDLKVKPDQEQRIRTFLEERGMGDRATEEAEQVSRL